MIVLFAFAATLLAGPDPAVPNPGAFQGPGTIIVHRQPNVPIVALRMSILADDPPGYAGAGHTIQHLAYPSLSDRVGRVGGTVQIERTADAIVYTATGPAIELPFLAESLVSVLRVPDAPRDAVLRVSREVREERLAEWETAPGHVRAALRQALFPSELSAAGTDRSAARFDERDIAAIWAAIYRPERVAVVAVGDVSTEAVERAFAYLPDPPDVRPITIQRDTLSPGALAPAQATQAWFGIAFPLRDSDPAAATVTARLLQQRVQSRVPRANITAEHWWSHFGQALVLVGSVPARDFADLQRAMNSSATELRGNLSFLATVEAARAIRHEVLFYSRTPDRMAEVIGTFADRDAEPGAMERFYEGLGLVDDRDVRNVLEDITEAVPERIEIPPQVLRR